MRPNVKQKKSAQEASIMTLQLIQTGRHDLPDGTIIENSAGPLAKTWPEPTQTEQPEGRSQDERNKTVLKAFFTTVRTRSDVNPTKEQVIIRVQKSHDYF